MLDLIEKIIKNITGFFNELKERRIHVVAAYYYIGAWQVLEPLIAVFGFEQDVLRLIKNVVVSLFPLVLVFTWFHGKPKKQPVTKLEGIIYIPMILLSIFIYLSLPGLPKPAFTVLVQDVQRDRQKFFAEQLNQFAEKNSITLHVRHLDSGSGSELKQISQSLTDSSNNLLAVVPLYYSGVLMNHEPALLQSYDEILMMMPPKDRQNFDILCASFDPTALRFSRRMKNGGEYFFLPFEYELPVMVCLKSKVEEAAQSWFNFKDEMNATLHKLSGTSLPNDFVLETDLGLWDYYDLFVASYYWNKTYPTINGYGRLAYPWCNDALAFTLWINKALSCGASLNEVFNLSSSLNLPSESLVEAFYWDALLHEARLCNSNMWLGAGVGHLEVVELLKTKNIFAAFLPSSDIGLLEFPEIFADLLVVPFPHGESCQSFYSLPNIQLLAIPQRSPNPILSLQLAQWLTGQEQQLLRASKQLSVPVLTDLINFTVKPAFRPPLKLAIWQSLVRQVPEVHKWSISPFSSFDEADYYQTTEFYFKKWREIVIDRRYLSPKDRISKDNITATLISP